MVWDYQPGTDPIRHPAGDHPARPLRVGDKVVWGKVTRTILGTTDTLLLFDGRWQYQQMFRRPIEGDFTQVGT